MRSRVPRRHSPHRTVVRAATALVAVALLAGCGDGGGAQGDAAPLKAAEPSVAPVPAREPAGVVAQVASEPQGIVYDAKTDSLAVAVRDPDRLLVLDPRTLAVRMSITLPGKSRHLGLSARGGTVLVPNETSDTLFEVDLRTGDMVATTVGAHPHNAASADNGDVVVGNEFDGSISVVRDGRVVHTFDDLQQPGGAVVDGRTMVAVDVGDFSISTYDLDTMKRLDRVPGGAGPTHDALVSPNKVAIADTRAGTILVYSDVPLKQIGSLDLGAGPYGLASDPVTRTVWVTLTATNEVVGLDVSGTSPVEIARFPTVQQPDTVAVAPGAKTLWVTGTATGEVQRISR